MNSKIAASSITVFALKTERAMLIRRIVKVMALINSIFNQYGLGALCGYPPAPSDSDAIQN